MLFLLREYSRSMIYPFNSSKQSHVAYYHISSTMYVHTYMHIVCFTYWDGSVIEWLPIRTTRITYFSWTCIRVTTIIQNIVPSGLVLQNCDLQTHEDSFRYIKRFKSRCYSLRLLIGREKFCSSSNIRSEKKSIELLFQEWSQGKDW